VSVAEYSVGLGKQAFNLLVAKSRQFDSGLQYWQCNGLKVKTMNKKGYKC